MRDVFKAEETLKAQLYGEPSPMRTITTDCSEDRAAELIKAHGITDAAVSDDSVLLELGNSTALRFYVRHTYEDSWLECEQYTRLASDGRAHQETR
jgi:hypothetical protein